MQVLWCLAVYVGSTFLNRQLTKSQPPGQKRRFRRHLPGRHLPAVLWGLGAILIADQLSQETPLWPALTFVTLLGGMLFPFGKGWRGAKGYLGFSCYWGGLLYLDPWLALILLALATEIVILTGDRLAGVLLFASLVPVLLHSGRWNPGFVWAAIGIGALAVFAFYPELRQRWLNFWKTAAHRG